MDKRKLVLAYSFLVGLPLLALLGVLHAGTKLAAPMALRGNWNVEADFSAWRSMPCGDPLANVHQPLLTIIQSGHDVTVAINDAGKTVLVGTIDGSTLTATQAEAQEGTEGTPKLRAGCSEPHPLHLQASAKEPGKQRSLIGTLSLDGCPNCPTLAFSAIRQLPEVRTNH